MRPNPSLRPAALVAAMCVLFSTVVTPAATADTGTVINGLSQPVYSLSNAIVNAVWIETGLDLNGDGRIDRAMVDIIRPGETAGRKVPTIMDASPYYHSSGRGNESEKKTDYDSQGRLGKFPLFLDNYFVPRGYAVALLDLAGTARAVGCNDVGGRSDIASARAYMDWIGGRAKGYDSASGGRQVTADWAAPAVGMIGKSWDGTIANGVAATGVPELKTIVPEGAISSWYDYQRGDGVGNRTPTYLANLVEMRPRAGCDGVKNALTRGAPANGNMTGMWRERDYVKDAAKVKAAVFVVHGQGDLNVKTIHWGQWLDALPRSTPRKVWLSQAGHVDPFDFRRKEWVETLHRWYDHWLLGVDNGIMKEPLLTVERAPDKWSEDATYPPSGTEPTALYPQAGSTNGLGGLSAKGPATGDATATFTDNGRGSEFTWARNPGSAVGDRVLFNSGRLEKDLRISGVGSITAAVTPSSRTAHLSVALVDYGPATIRAYRSKGEGITTLNTKSCWGEKRPGDDGCYRDTRTTSEQVDTEVFARGWADLANHRTLDSDSPLTPGQRVTMTFRISAVDHVIPAGHQFAVIIGGTDSPYIPAPSRPGGIKVHLDATKVTLPLVGGVASFQTTPMPLLSEGRFPAPEPGFEDRVHLLRP